MGLIDDDDLMIGQQCTAGGDMHPVEMRVDDDHVGIHGRIACSLGEAFVTLRASGCAGAFAWPDADG
jgi:hypothetical protein